MLRHPPPLFYNTYGVQNRIILRYFTLIRITQPVQNRIILLRPNLKNSTQNHLKPTPRAKNRLLLPKGSTKTLKPNNSKKKKIQNSKIWGLYIIENPLPVRVLACSGIIKYLIFHYSVFLFQNIKVSLNK